jgi:signal transduction histidine kinase
VKGAGIDPQAYRRLAEAAEVQRRLNDRLEAERQRIAHALHDETQQLLANVSIVLEGLRAEAPASCDERITEVRTQLHTLSERVRELSHELRPTILDELGLVPALRFLADGLSRATPLEVEVEAEACGPLPDRLETPLYRIAQEALANVVDHSRARRAVVRVRRRRRALRLSIDDDGIGFDVASTLQTGFTRDRGLGLAGIRERVGALAGTLEIHSTPGGGSRILIEVPLPRRKGDATDADSPVDRRRPPPGP